MSVVVVSFMCGEVLQMLLKIKKRDGKSDETIYKKSDKKSDKTDDESLRLQ